MKNSNNHKVDPKRVPKELMVNEHSQHLVNTEQAGNGYHGNCAYCGMSYVTDLGYCSWSGTKCIERAPESVSDLPEDMRSYVKFSSMRMVIKNGRPLFVKSYTDVELTLKQLHKKIKQLKTLAHA